jgi:hypothetical protein
MLLVLLLLLPLSQQVQAQWQECSTQGAFIGMYGSQALANLTAFRSNLLSNVWQSYNPEGVHTAAVAASACCCLKEHQLSLQWYAHLHGSNN